MTPASRMRTSRDAFQKRDTSRTLLPRSSSNRPLSEMTEIFDTDEEDDESVFEENSPRGSFDSMDSRRRSQTTVSSYEEALTPRSDVRFERHGPFEVRIKPVEGPKGPHLFRSSQSSADFAFDFALQMSPLLPKAMGLPDVSSMHSPQAGGLSPRGYAPERYAPEGYPMPAADDTPGYSPPKDVIQWSTNDILDWLLSSGLPHEVVDKFEKHDINGAILMELEFDNLKELDIESFGKRHQLWNAIQNLRGGERGPSPVPTPFQDVSRPPTNIRTKSDGDIPHNTLPQSQYEGDETPISPVRQRKRRGRKNRHHDDVITPAESISIVAIEQLLPKPHKCAKGENCPKWRKQQKLFARIQQEQGFPVSPDHGGHILVSGDPGNAASAQKILPDVHRKQQSQLRRDEPPRPVSENIPPSIVASSDLLGPGQFPAFALHENMLSGMQVRDPRENVMQFLSFQHVGTPPVESPPTPPHDTFPEDGYQMFPPAHQEAYPSLQKPVQTQTPHENLKSLPKLAIPRSASANPASSRQYGMFSPSNTTFSPCRSVTASPGAANLWRHGTPASEMDVPVTAVPFGPISRDTSQSVPPNMQFREHTRADWRRPSYQLPAVDEDAVFSPTATIGCRAPVVDKAKQKEMKKAHAQATYGDSLSHAGYMKKRKTKLLRHEWHNAHFRLHGTQLDMHESNRLSANMLDSIDVDDYAIACCNLPSNNKITAALRNLKLGDHKKKDADAAAAAAFAFQLIPSDRDRVKLMQGKTHHFAVTTSDERIDWMRELMLAKALRQKQSGFEVEHNGAKA